MPRPPGRILAALGVMLLFATGAVALLHNGKSGERPAGATPPAASVERTDTVEITDFKYKPRAVEVSVGSKVTFVNDDTAAHTVTSKAVGAFDSGSIRRGESKSVIVKKAGDFAYYCAFHPFIRQSSGWRGDARR